MHYHGPVYVTFFPVGTLRNYVKSFFLLAIQYTKTLVLGRLNSQKQSCDDSRVILQSSQDFFVTVQGLLELLWTVESEGKLQSCLKLRNFHNPFNKDKPVGLYSLWSKRRYVLKFALVVELAELNFTYNTVSKQLKLGLGFMKFLKSYENMYSRLKFYLKSQGLLTDFKGLLGQFSL